jgi:chemotaxis signal transduction protein
MAHDLIEGLAMVSTETLDPESLRDPDRAQPHAAAIATTDYFVFRLRGRTYALAPSCVEIVVPVQPLVAIPTTGPHVRGVMYLRGRVIAVIDLVALLGIDDQPQSQDSARLIVIDAPCPFAFVADVTLGIWAFADTAQTRTTDDGPLVSARIEDRGGAATLLDPRAVFDRIVSLRAERP